TLQHYFSIGAQAIAVVEITAEPLRVGEFRIVAGCEAEQTGRNSDRKELRTHIEHLGKQKVRRLGVNGSLRNSAKYCSTRQRRRTRQAQECGNTPPAGYFPNAPAVIRRATLRRFRMSSAGLAETSIRSARFSASIVPRSSN